jgi:TRAP-type C4-dicarboxylate transport system permease small subunit
MNKVHAAIDRMLFYLVGALLGGVVCICFAQVIARYIFNSSFTWAEEISIVILLWAAWIGACLGVKDNLHLRVSLVEDRLTPRTRFFFRLAMNSLAVVFLAIIAFSSRMTINAMANMTLGSLPSIPMNTMYWSVPVGCLLLIYYLVRSIVMGVQDFQRPAKEYR